MCKNLVVLLPILVAIAWFWAPVAYAVGLIELTALLIIGVVGTIVLILSFVLWRLGENKESK